MGTAVATMVTSSAARNSALQSASMMSHVSSRVRPASGSSTGLADGTAPPPSGPPLDDPAVLPDGVTCASPVTSWAPPWGDTAPPPPRSTSSEASPTADLSSASRAAMARGLDLGQEETVTGGTGSGVQNEGGASWFIYRSGNGQREQVVEVVVVVEKGFQASNSREKQEPDGRVKEVGWAEPLPR